MRITHSRGAPGFEIEVDDRLIEKSVMAALEGHPRHLENLREREDLYLLADCEERGRRFSLFYRRWFLELSLGSTVVSAIEERPSVLQRTSGCRILPALRSKNEGADLAGEAERPFLIILLRPEALVGGNRLRSFLRHELTHVEDMLDPAFGYRSEGWQTEEGPVCDNLIRERYRVLWDTAIDGRLLRRGWAPEDVLARRRAEFAGTFPMLGDEAESIFLEWFEGRSPTHRRMVEFARRPGARSRDSQHRGRCPLCRFPSFDLITEDRPGAARSPLQTHVIREVQRCFPDWKPSHGICRQCADLYEARELSRKALEAFPRA